MAFIKAFALIQRRFRGRQGERMEAAMIIEYVRQALTAVVDNESMSEIRPLYIKDGRAVIAVAHSLVAQELKLHERAIIEAVNKKIGSTYLSGIRFLA